MTKKLMLKKYLALIQILPSWDLKKRLLGFQKLIQHMYLIKILLYLFLQALSMIEEL